MYFSGDIDQSVHQQHAMFTTHWRSHRVPSHAMWLAVQGEDGGWACEQTGEGEGAAGAGIHQGHQQDCRRDCQGDDSADWREGLHQTLQQVQSPLMAHPYIIDIGHLILSRSFHGLKPKTWDPVANIRDDDGNSECQPEFQLALTAHAPLALACQPVFLLLWHFHLWLCAWSNHSGLMQRAAAVTRSAS